MLSLSKTIGIIKFSQKHLKFSCTVPNSAIVKLFLKELTKSGLISGFTTKERSFCVFLRYDKKGVGFLSNIKMLSSASRKIYLKKEKILAKTGYSSGFVVSTTNGLSTNFLFYSKKLGGEVICYF